MSGQACLHCLYVLKPCVCCQHSSAQHDCLNPTHLATVSHNTSTSCIPTDSLVMFAPLSLIIPVHCIPLPDPPPSPSCKSMHPNSLCLVSDPCALHFTLPTPLPRTPRRTAPHELSAHISWPTSFDCTLSSITYCCALLQGGWMMSPLG